MVLVFLLFSILIILLFSIFLLILSDIKIKIENLHISNISGKFKILFISKICIYLFNKIKIFEIKIDDSKIRKLYKKGKLNFSKLRNSKINIEVLKVPNKMGLQIEKLKMQGYIGTKDAAYTAYIVSFINAIIPIIISNKVYDYKKCKYKLDIVPVYINQNLVKLEFNCIFTIKIVNIINMILSLLKKGRVRDNERTSNRRTYAYGHE